MKIWDSKKKIFPVLILLDVKNGQFKMFSIKLSSLTSFHMVEGERGEDKYDLPSTHETFLWFPILYQLQSRKFGTFLLFLEMFLVQF